MASIKPHWIVFALAFVVGSLIVTSPTAAKERGRAAVAPAGSRVARSISLEDALARGLAANVDLRIERLSVRIAATHQGDAYALFDLMLLGRFQAQQAREPFFSSNPLVAPLFYGKFPSPIPAVDTLQSLEYAAEVSLREKLPWTGTHLEVLLLGERRRDQNAFSLQPAYRARVAVGIKQPLLRGFGPTPTLHALHLAEIEERASRLVQEGKVQEIVSGVIEAYWSLVLARQVREIRRQALARASSLVRRTRERLKAGVARPGELRLAEASEEKRREELREADLGVRDAQDTLLVLIHERSDAIDWGAEMVPTDRPSRQSERPDLEQAIADALQHRPDYRALSVDLERSALEIEKAEDDLLPNLNLYGGVGLSGLEDDPWNTFLWLQSGRFYQWTAGVELEVPLFRFQAKAASERARLERDRAMLRRQKLELQIVREVRSALRSLEFSALRVQRSVAGTATAHTELRDEEQRLKAGESTIEDLVRAQERLAEAELSEKKAIHDAAVSKAKLDLARGRILEAHGIAGSEQ